MLTKKDIENMLYEKATEAINEIKIRKIVNRRGIVTKRHTAGVKGKKVVNGKVKTISSLEKKDRRLGLIKKKRTLRSKSSSLKRKSIRFAVAGAKKHRALGIH